MRVQDEGAGCRVQGFTLGIEQRYCHAEQIGVGLAKCGNHDGKHRVTHVASDVGDDKPHHQHDLIG